MKNAQKAQFPDNCSKCPICDKVADTWGRNIWRCGAWYPSNWEGPIDEHSFEYKLMNLESDTNLLHFYIENLSCRTAGHIYEWNFENQELTLDKILIKKTDTPVTEIKKHFNKLKVFF